MSSFEQGGGRDPVLKGPTLGSTYQVHVKSMMPRYGP